MLGGKELCASLFPSDGNFFHKSERTMTGSQLRWVIYLVYLLVFSSFVFECNCQLIPDIPEEDSWKCEKITVKFCQDVGYNVTRMPNLANNDDQKHAELELTTFLPLIQYGCSSQTKLFLCTVYTPYCTEKVNKIVYACRPLCEHVRENCLPIMKRYGFSWPSQLNCSRFPPQNDENSMCIQGNISILKPTDNSAAHTPRKTKKKNQKVNNKVDEKDIQGEKEGKSRHKVTNSVTGNNGQIPIHPIDTRIIPIAYMRSSKKFCRMMYARNGDSYHYVDKIRNCALGCEKDGIYTGVEKAIAERWMAALSYLCAVVSFMAVIVVIFDYHSTCYPERAIVFISICYFFYSVAFIVRILQGRSAIGCGVDMGSKYVLQDGSGNIGCATTFLLAYCFSMAQSLWWVTLTLAWFLTAGMKWKLESMKSYSVYFHVVAWGIPCGKTVIILVLRKIDVDELTGLCYVGNRFENLGALRGFIVGPLFTYLIMGTTFLCAGFVALFKIRPVSCASTENVSDSKLDRPLLPIGIFAALHTLFSTFVLASYFYEYVNKESWYTNRASSGPNFEVFLLRLIMYFAIGLLSSLWICVLHTPRTWQRMVRLIKESRRTETMPQREPLNRNSNETSL